MTSTARIAQARLRTVLSIALAVVLATGAGMSPTSAAAASGPVHTEVEGSNGERPESELPKGEPGT